VHGTYQSKLTLMSESLRNDGRVWVPKNPGDKRKPSQIPENERDYYLERKYPSFGNLVPSDVASRNAKEQCDRRQRGRRNRLAVYLDFADAIKRDGRDVIERANTAIFSRCMKKSPATTPTHPHDDLSGGALHHGRACGSITT
jgi:succinate dehydrogenase / fumarate reductase, flavoprotein subunit